MKKVLYTMLFILALIIPLAACGGNKDVSGNEDTKAIKIGVTAGPYEEIANEVKKLAAKEDIELEVVPFNDFILPNKALTSGDLDLNAYQNIPFLATYNEDHNTDIVGVGKTVSMLMGIYSLDFDKIEDLPQGATVGLQNDPVNRSRGLHVYEEAGLIKLKQGIDKDKATVQDIAENPKGLKFKEMEAGMLARTLTSLDASVINGNYALQEGYDPKEDAIFINYEDKYVNLVATTKENKDNETYKRIAELYHAEEVKKFIEEKYKGVVILAEDPFEGL